MAAKSNTLDRCADKALIKCVVWDLDDTLWRGTLMENDDVVLTPGVKAIVQELDNRGILQSVASKNDYKLAWKRLAAFGLDEYFLHPQIGWGSKPRAMRNIATRLGFSLDSLAFVDDQAWERDEVRYFLPAVTTIKASDIGKLLDMPEMHPQFITDESRLRRTMYRSDVRRKELEEQFTGTREEFLQTLGMRITIRPAGEADWHRAGELTARTHQLNTTGRAYSYTTLRRLQDSPDHFVLVADLEDRYGSSGTVGLALIAKYPGAWLVKLLIMSCRVITRGVGGIMISFILQSAKRKGVRLRAEFVTNDLNRMMYVTYRFHGFREILRQESFITLEHDLERIRPFPAYVAVRSSSGTASKLH